MTLHTHISIADNEVPLIAACINTWRNGQTAMDHLTGLGLDAAQADEIILKAHDVANLLWDLRDHGVRIHDPNV